MADTQHPLSPNVSILLHLLYHILSPPLSLSHTDTQMCAHTQFFLTRCSITFKYFSVFFLKTKNSE